MKEMVDKKTVVAAIKAYFINTVEKEIRLDPVDVFVDLARIIEGLKCGS